eukprot:7046934-Prymnesium_polylepis.1
MSGISAFCALPTPSSIPALLRKDFAPRFDPQPSQCVPLHVVSDSARSPPLPTGRFDTTSPSKAHDPAIA